MADRAGPLCDEPVSQAQYGCDHQRQLFEAMEVCSFKLMRLILLIALVTIPAAAEWQRHVLTPKGERLDSPPPHPLSYFTQYPSLRDEDHDFCYLCSAEKSLAAAKQRKDQAEVKLVGRVREFEVYDVFYFFDEKAEPD
jgi:hypothetical protein